MIEFYPDEEWLEIPDWEDYLVSTYGRCYSIKTRRMLTLGFVQRHRGQSVTGEWVWHLRKPGNQRKMISAARMVLKLFEAARGHGWTPRYRDGDRSNIALSNLEWVQVNYQTYTAEELSAVMRERALHGVEVRRRKAEPPPAPRPAMPDFRSPAFLPPSRTERGD